MGPPAFQTNEQRFTYADYLTWPAEERWELIDGVAFSMTPAPSTVHQRLLIELGAQLVAQLRRKPCHPFVAPFDVRLASADETDDTTTTVVQPDLAVVCDPAKLDARGCKGAPDFILEIVSPSTAGQDQIRKVALYERHGVKEYWILHPIDRLLLVRTLEENGRYAPMRTLEAREKVALQALPGLEVDFGQAFEAVADLPGASG